MRALAQRSADAANAMKKLITSRAQQVSMGVERAGVRDAIENIAESAEQQATSLQQINDAGVRPLGSFRACRRV